MRAFASTESRELVHGLADRSEPGSSGSPGTTILAEVERRFRIPEKMLTHPIIPPDEFPARWAKVQRMMQEQALDLVIAYADDRAVFGPAHARWLANFPVHFESVCILLPRRGEPIMLCGPESVEYALLAGQIRDVRAASVFTHPDEDYPYARIYRLEDSLAEAADGLKTTRKVGLAGRGLMGFDAPWGGLRVEDGFHITEAGAERLNETPLLIQK